jgi:hypothetical protein
MRRCSNCNLDRMDEAVNLRRLGRDKMKGAREIKRAVFASREIVHCVMRAFALGVLDILVL